MNSFFYSGLSFFRQKIQRTNNDHLPYLLSNKTGSNLKFTTNVEELIKARQDGRRLKTKWHYVKIESSCTFEFPTKLLTMVTFILILLLYSIILNLKNNKIDENRLLIVKIDGWEEITPVNVDSVGTYFRVIRMLVSLYTKFFSIYILVNFFY